MNFVNLNGKKPFINAADLSRADAKFSADDDPSKRTGINFEPQVADRSEKL